MKVSDAIRTRIEPFVGLIRLPTHCDAARLSCLSAEFSEMALTALSVSDQQATLNSLRAQLDGASACVEDLLLLSDRVLAKCGSNVALRESCQLAASVSALTRCCLTMRAEGEHGRFVWFTAALAFLSVLEQMLSSAVGKMFGTKALGGETGFGLANEVYTVLSTRLDESHTPEQRAASATFVAVLGSPSGMHLRNLLWHGLLPPSAESESLLVLCCVMLNFALEAFPVDVQALLTPPTTEAFKAGELELLRGASIGCLSTNLSSCSPPPEWVPVTNGCAWYAAQADDTLARVSLLPLFVMMEDCLRQLAVRRYPLPTECITRLLQAHDGQQFYTLTQLFAVDLPHYSSLLMLPLDESSPLVDAPITPCVPDTLKLLYAAWDVLIGRIPPRGRGRRHRHAHTTLCLDALPSCAVTVCREMACATLDAFHSVSPHRMPAVVTHCANPLALLYAYRNAALGAWRHEQSSESPDASGIGLCRTGLVSCPSASAPEPLSFSLADLRVSIEARARPDSALEISRLQLPLPPTTIADAKMLPTPLVLKGALAVFDALQRCARAYTDDVRELQTFVEQRKARSAHRTKLAVLVGGEPLVGQLACLLSTRLVNHLSTVECDARFAKELTNFALKFAAVGTASVATTSLPAMFLLFAPPKLWI
jgi:hypothetical protein